MNKRIALLTIVVLLAGLPCAADDVQKTDLFVGGEGGYAAYRIPGIVALGENTVLAYGEARKNSAADWGEIDVLMRRSSDAGRTWGPPTKLGTPPGDARQNPAGPKRKDGGITVNNPVAIAGRDGVVHFLYCVEYGRCFYRRSDDGGEAFSPAVEITATFEKFRPEYDWKVIATGPGHGIRLAKTSDRLVVPVWMSNSANGPHRPSVVSTIYSDDDGKTWQRGDIVPTTGLVHPSETAVAQVKGGAVVLNIRHEGEPHLRAVVTGRDGATNWGGVRFDPALPEPVCMGSLLTVGQPGGRPDLLLFCNPHNPDGRERKNLTVKASTDGGETWVGSQTLEPGPSGYNDMAAVGRGNVLCLYERKGTLTLVRFGVLSMAPPRR